MRNILISRTDRIGDVILTLPMIGMINRHLPDSNIYFLVKSYTKAIAKKCSYIKKVYDWHQVQEGEEQLPHIDYFIHVFPDPEIARYAKGLGIKHRIGTSHRTYHWWTCNNLVSFTRKRSDLHESQLNMKLLRPLGIKNIPPVSEMHDLTGWTKSTSSDHSSILTPKFNLIFHIKSLGSAREWPLKNFLQLSKELSAIHFQIFITGTAKEGDFIKKEIPEIFTLTHVTDLTGQFTLRDFISFIEQCDGLLACSTGPLHIASVAGLKTLGLYPTKRPMHAGRWAPVGEHVSTLTERGESDDRYLSLGIPEVLEVIQRWV